MMMALTSAAGVTSKAGCAADTPTGAIRRPARWVTSSDERSSMTISSPVASARSTVEVGAAT